VPTTKAQLPQSPAALGKREILHSRSRLARVDLPGPSGREVSVASQSAEPATNERIVRLLEEVKAQLADSKRRQQQIAGDLTRLLKEQ